jgi:hypothetical protein
MYKEAKKVYNTTRRSVSKQGKRAVHTVAPVVEGVLMPIGYLAGGVRVLFDRTRNMLVFAKGEGKDKGKGKGKK